MFPLTSRYLLYWYWEYTKLALLSKLYFSIFFKKQKITKFSLANCCFLLNLSHSEFFLASIGKCFNSLSNCYWFNKCLLFISWWKLSCWHSWIFFWMGPFHLLYFIILNYCKSKWMSGPKLTKLQLLVYLTHWKIVWCYIFWTLNKTTNQKL